jgi:hypothetical protein
MQHGPWRKNMEMGKNTIFLPPIIFLQGGKHRQRIFFPRTPPAKVEQLLAWPRREKMKTQGEKIKTQGQK